MSFGISHKIFSSGAALQDYVLAKSNPGTFTVVPHQRLAHQISDRQRRAALAAGCPAWEPPTLRTLQAWWSELFQSLWPTEALAPPLVRLALWRQALTAAPPPPGPTPELAWAEALDEAHILLCRHLLGPGMAGVNAQPSLPFNHDSPLVAWRRRVTGLYTGLLRQGSWLSPGELPAYLLAALRQGQIRLPARVQVACLETPAPVEALWLQEVSYRSQLVHLQVRGHPQNVRDAVSLPDLQQELHWVAARLVELAQGDGTPLHRLAVTAMDLDTVYHPHLRRLLAEILGPPEAAGGGAYNFSRGTSLADAPLFAAGLLPLQFLTLRERREDLMSLLLSPYYGRVQVEGQPPAHWDQVWREHRCDQGWDRLRRTLTRSRSDAGADRVLARLNRVWQALNLGMATTGEWCRQLKAAWRELGFPWGLDEADAEAWTNCTELLAAVERALPSEKIAAGEFLEWLHLGARRVILAGTGQQNAGIQVLGLLEMRGLDFDRVFCLGMNSGVLPAPPRPLPLLAASEKRQVLGGTYQSQHQFAAALYQGLLGAAPHLTFTRPQMVEQEERVSTPLYQGEWSTETMAILSSPHPAWLRSPAVRAAFQPSTPGPSLDAGHPLGLSPPGELSLSQISTALGCPCRFLLEQVLQIKELPEIESGLDPRERGQLLHAVLACFVADFKKVLEADQVWDQEQARALLQKAAGEILAPVANDLHWQAEADRWLGESGLLWEWLRLEQERFGAGWRWVGTELAFQDLCGRDWPFTVKGRVDRLDQHPENGGLVVWDYKSGEIPKKQQVLEELAEPQLACYLLAVAQGCLPVGPETAKLRAGFIGLKSPRSHHLKHEDFNAPPEAWQAASEAFVQAVAALGRRLAAGDFRPDPNPAPDGKDQGACQYCPYGLICGFIPATAPAAEEEDL